MKSIFLRWLKANRSILKNAGSLVGTTAVTGVVGFVYWWVAARLFSLQSVGLGSAAVSAMTLLGNFCILGLGTLLISELPRQPGREPSLISTAVLIVGGVGACCGIAFALVAPFVSVDFLPFRASVGTVALFAVGVSLNTIVVVVDCAVVGLLRGELQFWRNTLFSVAKLTLLIGLGLLLLHKEGVAIYATVAVANVLSLLPLGVLVILKKGWMGKALLPDWSLPQKLGTSALQHHILNLILLVPGLTMPVMVTILLSAKTNAWFYIAWMISGLVFTGTYALTTVLYAINSYQTAELARKIRVTLGLSLAFSILGNCFLVFAAGPILSFFGHDYALHAAWTLRILGLGALPVIIKEHYVAVNRIHSSMTRAWLPAAIGSLLELCIAVLGAKLGGLTGLSIGWVVALCLEGALMFRVVYRAAFPASALTRTRMEQIPSAEIQESFAENGRV